MHASTTCSHTPTAGGLDHRSGRVADYIPVLAQADADAFGVCVADVDGGLFEADDTRIPFSIQSISKAYVYALLCEAVGHHEVRELVGVNNTGLPFNSVVAIEINNGHPVNPMVNAGAIAALLDSYGRMKADPVEVVDVYTRQCSLRVDARDLAVMSATLAGGSRNPRHR